MLQLEEYQTKQPPPDPSALVIMVIIHGLEFGLLRSQK